MLASLSAYAAEVPREAVQFEFAERFASGLPITLCLRINNTDSSPLRLARVGRAQFATANIVATVSGPGASAEIRHPFPWMLNGRVTEYALPPGGSLPVWGSLAQLPPGTYELTLKSEGGLGRWWAVDIGTIRRSFVVVDDADLRRRTLEQLSSRARDGDHFVASLAVHYRIRELLEVVLANLSSEDDERACVAAESLLSVYSDPPEGLTKAIGAALAHRPRPLTQPPRDYNIDPWVQLLRLARQFPDDTYIPALTELSSPEYGYTREYAMKALACQRAPAALDALRPYLADESPCFREIAACAFALRHDPIAIDALVKLSHERWYDGHPWVYGAMAQFPDDQRAAEALQAARASGNEQVRNAASKPTVQIPP